MFTKKSRKVMLTALLFLSAFFLGSAGHLWAFSAPYSNDANTVLLDHFDDATSASVLAYSETGAACGSAKPSATSNSAYASGPNGLSQSLSLSPPVGQPAGSATYLQYTGGQLLSQPNGTIEFWTYLTAYGTGVSLVDQGPYYGSCAGWTFGMGVNATGQLQAGAWAAFTMNSGATAVPLNTWTHVAASWGSAGAKLYINGVQVGSDVNTGMPASGFGGSVLIRAGTHTGAGSQIDELRISNVQRTSFSTSGGAGTGTHNASGTYTWNATTGVTTLTWTSSDFTCEGPDLGTEQQAGVTVTATTMTWANDDMTWTRSSGTAGDIVGTWTSTGSAAGNSYTLTFNANGTVSVTGIIVQCGGDGGGGGGSSAKAEAQHWLDGYHVQLRYSDPNRAASSVSVTGPGITGSVALIYNTLMGSWGSGTPESIISFGTTYPAGMPFTYTFSVTDATGTWTATSTVSCFQQPFVANISPAGSVTGTPTFSWTGITDSSAIYGVQVNDSNGNWLWADYNISGTSIAYNGPALTSGMTYGYVVSLESSSACNDQTSGGGSYVAGSFTYGSGSGATPHPEAAAIQTRFGAAIAAYNAGDFTSTGFASFISDSYLDGGEDKNAFITDAQQHWNATETLSWTNLTITGTGNNAVMTLTWSDGENDTLYFRKEGDLWMLYGDQMKYEVQVWSGTDKMQGSSSISYWGGMHVRDNGEFTQSVRVKGPGLALEGVSLFWNADYREWTSWSGATDVGPKFGNTKPGLPLDYEFTITEKANPSVPVIMTATVHNFVEVFATPQTPVADATVTGNPSFSWIGVSGGYTYALELNGPNGHWGRYNLMTTSYTYDGPTLPAGNYQYNIQVRDVDGNFSMVTVPFDYIAGSAVLKGDINGDGSVELADAILALQVTTGFYPQGVRMNYATSGADVDNNGKVDAIDLLYVLQRLAGLRQ